MSAELIDSIAALRERLGGARRTGATIGLVPTMGALHAGHARLIELARQQCQSVTVTIFVNPLQFDRQDDLSRYPRTFDADLEVCRQLGAAFVFAPSAAEMYPTPPACIVDIGRLGDHLCGLFRPGHFRGVATVVLKLLQIAQPDRAYFGQKDAQQLAIIKRMVSDFNVPVAIVGVPTVREADGLALSSRNRLLSPVERQSAISLYRALSEVERQISAGVTDLETVRLKALTQIPQDPSLRLEYLEIVDPEEMQPVPQINGPVLAAGALWVGSTRLIDNILCAPPPA